MHDSVKVISSSEEQIPISSLNVGSKSSQYTYYDILFVEKTGKISLILFADNAGGCT